jgi:hypothetical protein
VLVTNCREIHPGSHNSDNAPTDLENHCRLHSQIVVQQLLVPAQINLASEVHPAVVLGIRDNRWSKNDKTEADWTPAVCGHLASACAKHIRT